MGLQIAYLATVPASRGDLSVAMLALALSLVSLCWRLLRKLLAGLAAAIAENELLTSSAKLGLAMDRIRKISTQLAGRSRRFSSHRSQRCNSAGPSSGQTKDASPLDRITSVSEFSSPSGRRARVADGAKRLVDLSEGSAASVQTRARTPARRSKLSTGVASPESSGSGAKHRGGSLLLVDAPCLSSQV